MKLQWIFLTLCLVLLVDRCQAGHRQPNIIMILSDDMGYADIAAYGHPSQEYGPVDVMADKGLLFTQAYSADSVCSPSRAALLTGRLPVRMGIWGENRRLFLPWLTEGLPRDDITIAEGLKQQNYTTGMVGKWHLGINKNTSTDGYHLPPNHGFDFVGHLIPHSGSNSCDENGRYKGTPKTDKCFLYYRNEIIQQPYHYENLTVLFVNDTLDFIRRNKDEPFFFYFSSMHPHVPMFASSKFKGSSKRGTYGDNINELSWAVGSIIKELEAQKIENDTLVVFMSDHGPHPKYCLEGGDAGVFRGFKGNSFEGGYRVPLIAYWPGVIRPGVSNEMISSLDLFSIFLELGGGKITDDKVRDGVNGAEVLLGMGASKRNSILFYNRDILFAVRYGKYKLHFLTQEDYTPEEFADVCLPPGYPIKGSKVECNEKDVAEDCVHEHDPPLIYNLDTDPSESWPLDPDKYNGLLEEVQNFIAEHEAGLIRVPPLMDTDNRELTPCCNVDTDCVCNYP